MLAFLKHRRRRRLRERPFPEAWRQVLRNNVAWYRRLPSADQTELEKQIQVFVSEKRFEGCGGLEMICEIKVTVAAQACLLVLHRDHDYYPGLVSILVYPSSYVVPVQRAQPGGAIAEYGEHRSGEAWQHGTIVLAWDAVKHSATEFGDGHNVVFHEFAHRLDQEDGQADGAPILPGRARYASWARVLGREYAELQRDTSIGRATLIREYGATNPAEFFAVVTEHFFEQPIQLRTRHPDLYEELKSFYQQDPAALAERSPGQPP